MSFDLYFAGSQHKESDKLMKELSCCRLHTQLNRNACKDYINAKKDNSFNGKLLIDSGAFTQHTKGIALNVDDYINFINENTEYINLFIQVDSIPGRFGQPRTFEQIQKAAQDSWTNYLYMRQKIKEPNKLLPVFHQDEEFKYLQQMLEYTDSEGNHIPYICISSSKDKSSNLRYDWYKKVFEIIETSSNPNVKTHSLGTSSIKHLETIPFTSSDATSWLQTAAMGNIYTKWRSCMC